MRLQAPQRIQMGGRESAVGIRDPRSQNAVLALERGGGLAERGEHGEIVGRALVDELAKYGKARNGVCIVQALAILVETLLQHIVERTAQPDVAGMVRVTPRDELEAG